MEVRGSLTWPLTNPNPRYHRVKKLRRGDGHVNVAFYCAQSVAKAKPTKKPKRSADGATRKTKDGRRMEHYDCDGWLFIDVDASSPDVVIRLQHTEKHTPYVDVEIPEKWKEFILAHLDWTPGKV